MADEDRKLGIDVLGALPWGKHLCYFYNTKQDLVDVLVPYFKAGLENNEYCLCLTSETLSKKEAEETMGKAIPDFSKYLASGQIEIIPYTEGYLKDGVFNKQMVLNKLADKIAQAMDKGYDGVRTTGDMSWVERRDWSKFIDYEKEVNNTIGKNHWLALCTYPLHKHGTSQAINVMSNHQYNLIKYKDELVLIGGSERERAYNQSEEQYHSVILNLREELQEAEERFYKAARASNDVIAITTLNDGKFIDVNDNFFRVFGYTRDEVIGRSSIELNLWTDPKQRERIIKKLKQQGRTQEEVFSRTKSGEILTLRYSAELHTIGGQTYIITVVTDITGRKKAEEKEQAIISTAIDGFWTTDLSGKFLEVNDSYCRMIGYTREELLKMSIQDVEALERPEDTAEHIRKIIKRGSDRFKTQHRCKDGKIIDIEINVNYNNAGKGQFFVFIHDLTALKHAEESQAALSRIKPGRHLTELQERFVREGFEELEDQEIIELLLSLVLPVQKARQLARACMERFRNLSNFLAAPYKEQQEVGITPTCMLCIKLLHELPAKVLKQRIVARSIYKSSKEVFDYLYYSMRDLKKEVFKVIYLDNRSQIIDTADLFEGTADNIPIRPREIVESTLTQGATGLIFVHNHPTGDPTPSRSDKQLTRDLVFVGNILQIKVLDHIIIGADSYFSFTDDGLTQKYQDNFLNLKIQGVLASRPLYHIYRRLPKGLHHQHLNTLFNKYQLHFTGFCL